MTKKAQPEGSFADIVREMCDEKNIKIKELIKRLGVSQGVVSKYLNGVNQPGWEQIMLFSLALECSPRDLVPEKAPAEYAEKLAQRVKDSDKVE